MPNGKPGDHPVTDWCLHQNFAFPEPLESLLRKLEKANRFEEIPESEFLRWFDALTVLENAKTYVNQLLHKKKKQP